MAVGARYFVIALTLTSRRELEELRRALPQVSLRVCRVDASPRIIGERIRRRELGTLGDDFLSRTDALAAQIQQAGIDDLVVTNNRRPISELARELGDRLDWK